jgi:DnaJ domain
VRNHYRILGIRPDATQEEIKEAWSFFVKAFHPDKFAGSSQRQQTVAGERTKAINEAYEVLSDPKKRASCDREYAREPRAHSTSPPPPQPPPTPPPRPTPPQDDIRAERCRNCGGRVFGHGVRDKLGIFCSTVCRNNFKHPRFCNACSGASTPISAGDNFRINGIGNSFFGAKDQCETCGSIVQTLWSCIFFIPIVPSGKFRVKYVAPGSYLSRKLPKIHSAAQPPPRPTGAAEAAKQRVQVVFRQLGYGVLAGVLGVLAMACGLLAFYVGLTGVILLVSDSVPPDSQPIVGIIVGVVLLIFAFFFGFGTIRCVKAAKLHSDGTRRKP